MRTSLISIIDERTACILGWLLTTALDSESVLDLLEKTFRRHGRPRYLVSDRGGHFRRRVGGRAMVESHSRLIERAMGALGAFGVERRMPREKNPRGNRFERMHRIYANLARGPVKVGGFGPSWCGANTADERALTGINERIKWHLKEHCRLGISGPLILSLDEGERIIAGWVEEINLAPTEAQGCEGLTRLAAWRRFQAPEEERERWRVNPDLLAVAFAQHSPNRTIQTGGTLRLPDGIEYESPELLLIQGEQREVARLRHDNSFVAVLPAKKGQETIVAFRRMRVGTRDAENLARASEYRARLRKVAELFGAQYREDQPVPVDSPAQAASPRVQKPVEVRVEQEPSDARDSLPSLYDLGECTAEEM